MTSEIKYLEVVGIELIETKYDYVYDLETEDGTFVASSDPNKQGLVCKNTDSCYVTFDIPKHLYTKDGIFDEIEFMKANFKMAQQCADFITGCFKNPIKLEFEKIMYPFFIYQKKRYAYKEWIKPEAPNDVEYKGLSLVRRDFCEYVKDVCDRIFRILMTDKSISFKETEDTVVVIEKAFEKKDDIIQEVIVKEIIIDKKLSRTLDDSKNSLLESIFKEIIPASVAVLYTRKAIYDLLVANTVSQKELTLSKSLRSTYKADHVEIRWNKGLCKIHKCEVSKGQKCNMCEKCNTKNHGILKFTDKTSNSGSKQCSECAKAWIFINSPHVVIANRLREKDPINGPKPPDRVQFLYTYVPHCESKMQYEFAFHPSELGSKKINYLYYFDHQLKNSIDQMYPEPNLLYNDIVQECINKNDNQSSLMSFARKTKI